MSLGQFVRRTSRWILPEFIRHATRPAAVFFHGVERRADDPIVRLNHHDIDSFLAIAWSLKRNFDVLPLSEIGEVLKAPKKHARSVFLMSDDGYANTLAAADILDELRLPWTLFVSTHHIDTGERNPMFLARLFFRFAPVGTYEIPHLGPLVLATPQDREELAASTISQLREIGAERGAEAVAAMMATFGEAAQTELFSRFPSESFLTWNQVRALHARGVEIGAHAHRHWPMSAAQSADDVSREAQVSRDRIEMEVGPCRFFAYPFGNVGDVSAAAWRAVRDAGFEYGFTTLSGTLEASANPFLMPRYGLAAQEPNLASLLPSLRLANGRLREFQASLGSGEDTGQAPRPVRLPLKQSARNP